MVAAPDKGDANLDGTVGNADFGTVLGNFGATNVGWAGGDLNGDGFVGNADFGLVLGNFGFTAPLGSINASSTALANIPEPSTLILAMMALLAGSTQRNRQRPPT